MPSPSTSITGSISDLLQDGVLEPAEHGRAGEQAEQAEDSRDEEAVPAEELLGERRRAEDVEDPRHRVELEELAQRTDLQAADRVDDRRQVEQDPQRDPDHPGEVADQDRGG